MGMTADEFWHGPAWLARSYREAWRMRMQSAYMAEWRQGLYVLHALGAALSDKAKYPEEPLFTMESAEEAEERRARERMERIKRSFQQAAVRIAARRKAGE